MKKHAFRIGLVVTMLLGLMMISANAACACEGNPHTTTDHSDWTPITATTTTMSGGNYFLDSETVSVNSAITVSGNVTICLNGNTLNFSNAAGGTSNGKSGIVIGAIETTLNICDCSAGQTGKITTSHTSGHRNLIFSDKKTSTINLWGGTLDATTTSTVSSSKYYSATIYTTAFLNFNMHGGSLIGNTQGSAALDWYHNGTVTICDGTISNPVPAFIDRLKGSNARTPVLNITGGTIANTAADGNVVEIREGDIAASYATVDISGSPVVTGAIYNEDKDTTAPTVFNISGGKFSTTLDTSYIAEGYIQDTDGSVIVKPESKEVELTEAYVAGLTVTDDMYVLPYGDYYLNAPLTLDKTLNIASGEVTLDLKGFTLTSSAPLAINVTAGLNLKDTSEAATGAIVPATGTNSQGINVAGTGTLNMTGGAIDGFNCTGSGAGVVVSGTFNMSGGTIKNCVSGKNAGGINVTGGTVTISGTAVITGNTAAANGGAIQVPSAGGTVTITGGQVYANTGANIVYLNGDGTMEISGGYFYGNTGVRCLYNQNGTLTITGGSFGLMSDGTVAAHKNADDALAPVIYINGNGSTKISGGSFYFGDDDMKLVYPGVSSGYDLEITGGTMSGNVRSSWCEKVTGEETTYYFAYKLAANADSNTPYQIAETFKASKMELKFSGTYGFYMRVFYTGCVGAFKNDYTIVGTSGSERTRTTTYVDWYIPAKDMSGVTLTLKNDGRTAVTTTVSVKEYAEKLLATSEDSMKKALSDMLRYGDAAYAYFYQSDDTTTVTADVAGLVDGSTWTVEDSSDLSDDVDQLYQGSSLSLKNNINMNLYFAGNVADVSVNGSPVDLTEDADGHQVASVAINMQNMANDLTIVITAEGSDPITITDSIQAYAYRAQNLAEGNQPLADLCKAMMNFVLSADAHFNPAS